MMKIFLSIFCAIFQHLPVPELILIRLTRQLIEMMSPIKCASLFCSTMIHTMNALKDNSDLLLSTMDVFIKEPLMEWMVSSICLSFLSRTSYLVDCWNQALTRRKQQTFVLEVICCYFEVL